MLQGFDKMKFNERVKFRLIQTPCCGHMLCWVNPRLPNFCPECGKKIFTSLKFEIGHIINCDDNAHLSFTSR